MAKNIEAETSSATILDLVSRVEKLLNQQASNPRQRMLVALAGVPGSGKSTVSLAVMSELGRRGVSDVAVIPMDGFHYAQKVLSKFPDPELAFRRRGAPFTFDAEACVDLVSTLRSSAVTSSEEAEYIIYAPSFDHATKDPIAGDILVSSRTRLIIVEGNYTLLRQSPWHKIGQACDEKWFVDGSPAIVRERLAHRHLQAGIEASLPAAFQRAEENDIPNGDLIRSLLVDPDVIIQN